MKIIHYIPTIDKSSGGIGSFIQLLSKSLGEISELHIITHKSPNPINIENAQIHFIESKLIYISKIKRDIVTILNEIKPNIVHINCCWYPCCSLVLKWARELGYKTVLSPHGMLEPWVLKKNKWKKDLALFLYQKETIKNANTIIATSEVEKNNILKLKWNSKVEIIPNGLIIDGIKCKESWKQKKCILFLALLRENKGAHLLIEAVNCLKEQLKDWKIVIAGQDNKEYYHKLVKLTQKYRLEKNIVFPGSIFGKEKWELYRNADIFVLPTLNENFGIVIAESLLCGTPVITCKGAPWEKLNEERCGWWVNRNIKDIAAAINTAINLDESQLKSMGLRGRELVIKNYDTNLIAKQFMILYSKIVDSQ